MSKTVIEASTIFRPAVEPDNGVVELLRALLTRAEQGELIGMAGVGRLIGGEFLQFSSPSARDNAPIFLGYLRVLEMRLEREVARGFDVEYGDEGGE